MAPASVYPLVATRAVAGPYTYDVPEGVRKGAVVAVRFGRAARRGVVAETGVAPPVGIELAAAVVIVAAVATAGSVFLAPIANGIGTLMLFGAGLLAGLLGEIGHAIQSHKLQHISRIVAWFVPFDALYEDALHRLTVDTTGFARFVLELGPFGGSHRAGTGLLVWSGFYLVLVLVAAVVAFSRRDL